MENLCVIFGGRSPEHDVSGKSVTSVLNNLDKSKYNISVIGITKDGRWYLYYGAVENIASGAWEKDEKNKKKAIISPDAADKCLLVFCNDTVERIPIDVVFPVLHGEFGEDGTIQGLLEIADIPYVGMGVLASANGMDKTYSKIVFDSVGIPQAAWIVVNKGDDIEAKADETEKKLGYPCFVKPARTGSSVGVTKAHNRNELLSAIANASKFDRRILIEEYIDGHEVECAVLGNNNVRAAQVGEIEPAAEFYDFDAKYNNSATQLRIPANIPEETREQIRELSVKAFKALDGQGLTRCDFFVKYSDGSVVLNEVNTMPGFTDISMYPKLWCAVGMEYSELLDKLIELAKERVK